MKVDDLLTELRGNLPIPALANFNTYIEESSNAQGIINGLLLASTNCDEILNLLMSEKRTSSELATIFSTLSHVLLNIASELSEFSATGLHVTRQLLHNHDSLLYKFLLPSNTNNNTKVVLRCITGMVLLGGEAANEVLATLNWSQINFSIIANRQSLKEVWDVRAWCIYLFLAFLNLTEEPYVIKQFLQKADVLPSVFQGLMWDPCERVINVLKVMHESILLNPNVTKTMKVALFTPTTSKALIDLYNWMGPMGKLSKCGSMDEMESDIAETIQKERVQIKEILQKFMLTLCSSFKHGIIFREKEQEGQIKSNNWYVYKIVSYMSAPWESAEGRELMSSILGSCPDLLKTYLPKLMAYLKPRPCKAFFCHVDMLIQIIENQKPWLKMETKGLSGILACLIPCPLNKNLFNLLLESPCASVKHCGIILILSILNQTKKTCDNITQSQTITLEVKENTQRKLVESVFKALVPVDNVVQCWNIASGQDIQSLESDSTMVEDVEITPINIQLLSIAKVLTLFTDLLPNQTVCGAMNPVEMLQSVRSLPDKGTDNMHDFNVKLELQVLCLGFMAGSKLSQEIVVDGSMTEETSLQQIEKNLWYQLISTYTESKSVSAGDEDDGLMISVTDNCLKVLSIAVAQVGLAAHYDGNIKFWLKHIPADNLIKLSAFLARVIQKTILSLSHYTDQVVEAVTKVNHQFSTITEGKVVSIMTAIDTMEITDNEDISQQAVSMPLSRLVLGAMDMLRSNPDPECIHYFSSVMNDYLYSLSDPGVLIDVLLQEGSIITPELQDYIKCWLKGMHKQNTNYPQLSDRLNLSEIIKYLFMTHDWNTVEKILEENKLAAILDKEDLDLVVSQILIYLCLESTEKKGAKIIKKYAYLLKEMYKTLDKEKNQNYVQCLLQMVLEHPRILAHYQPFSEKQSPITQLVQEFTELVLQKHFTLATKTSPYFEALVQKIQDKSRIMDVNIDVWSPFAPFITSKSTVVSYEALENLFVVCLESFSVTWPSQRKLFFELIQLLLKVTSSKRRLTPHSVQLMLAKFLEFGNGTDVENIEEESIMNALEKLLIQVMDAKAAEQLSADELKNLMRSQPSCPALCCHLVNQYPPHGHTFARHLKKHPTLLPAQAPLLAMLLAQEETAKVAESALAKLSGKLKTWVLTFEEEENETKVLIPHALQKNILDVECLTEVCRKLYEETVTSEQLLSEKIPSLLPVFHKLSEVDPQLSKFGLPKEHIAMLLICLSYIKRSYLKKEDNSIQLLEVAKLAVEVLPKIDNSLQKSLASNKLWFSFAKQVLRKSFGDKSAGPDMLRLLRLMCRMVYNREQEGCDASKDVLPITTIYKMIMSHTQYLTLMFNREAEWERLKEAVIELQQTLVDCQPEVCQEIHVPILLGAYNASMSSLDQHILMLLYTYEREGHMNTLHPILWGDVAVAHFGVQSQSTGFFRDPTPEQVLSLIDMDKLSLTCRTFNTRLPLEPVAVHPGDGSVYDVRFLLPLLMYLGLEGKTTLTEIDYAESGAVVLGFTALTSHERGVWGMGAALLKCMVNKMEKSSHRRLKLLWQWLVGVVSCSFEGHQRRLPALTAHFLVQAALLLSEPSHPMYQPVLNYIFILPVFKTYFVPELYEFFSSSHLTNNREHRSFLLTNLSDGIRQILDYKICQRSFTATLMIGMLQAPTADIDLKVQVLDVLEAFIKIHLGAVELVRFHNLLTVLPLVAFPDTIAPALCPGPTLRPGNPLLMIGVVRVLATLWATLMETITMKTIVSPSGEEEQEQENRKTKKRRNKSETYSKSFKRAKRENTDDTCDYHPDADDLNNDEMYDNKLNSGEASKKTHSRMLPPLFVHEYLNCLKILTPSILAHAPLTTSAQLLNLMTKAVEYVDVVATLAMDRLKLRVVALIPEVVKQQVYDHINWKILHSQLQEYLNDDEEVLMLGGKAKEMCQQWRSEPLSKHLHKKPGARSSDSKHQDECSTDCADSDSLKQSVIKLLKVLEK